jgi:hypothetical protein
LIRKDKNKILAPDKGSSSRNTCQRNFFTFNFMAFTFIKHCKLTFITEQQPSFDALRNKGFEEKICVMKIPEDN